MFYIWTADYFILASKKKQHVEKEPLKRGSQPVRHLGREKITLEDDIELFILKNGIVTYADIVSRIKASDEYITQAVKNLLNDGKIFRRKGEVYTAYA